ncbi:MAG: bile acid:sodium symporter [Sphingobium sp.]|nr:bile acid:sodium symporter [Sphingobium sp.]
MLRIPKIFGSLDPFLVMLIATLGAASLLPAQGTAAQWTNIAADLGIALLFFLHGAKLSRQAILQSIGNWKLHGLVFVSTYILFPIAGLAVIAATSGWINPLLASGLLFLTLLPSTVQSSIAFTAMAGGDVAAAVTSASLSNLFGILLTPLLVGLFMHAGGGVSLSGWGSVRSIVIQLLVPFVGGHLLRPWIGGFVERNKKILQPVDRGSILLVVYSAFSAAVVNGIWHRIDVTDLLELLLLSAVILAFIMGINILAARIVRLRREDSIVLLFCGSKKSLVSGVPLAGALFAPAQVGLVVLPLMIFHQLQLFVCAALAGRFRREGEALANAALTAQAIPRTQAEIESAASAIGMTMPPVCMAGVIGNMALLQRHADILLARDEDPGP